MNAISIMLRNKTMNNLISDDMLLPKLLVRKDCYLHPLSIQVW
jgi:hypothetical protein